MLQSWCQSLWGFQSRLSACGQSHILQNVKSQDTRNKNNGQKAACTHKWPLAFLSAEHCEFFQCPCASETCTWQVKNFACQMKQWNHNTMKLNCKTQDLHTTEVLAGNTRQIEDPFGWWKPGWRESAKFWDAKTSCCWKDFATSANCAIFVHPLVPCHTITVMLMHTQLSPRCCWISKDPTTNPLSNRIWPVVCLLCWGCLSRFFVKHWHWLFFFWVFTACLTNHFSQGHLGLFRGHTLSWNAFWSNTPCSLSWFHPMIHIHCGFCNADVLLSVASPWLEPLCPSATVSANCWGSCHTLWTLVHCLQLTWLNESCFRNWSSWSQQTLSFDFFLTLNGNSFQWRKKSFAHLWMQRRSRNQSNCSALWMCMGMWFKNCDMIFTVINVQSKKWMMDSLRTPWWPAHWNLTTTNRCHWLFDTQTCLLWLRQAWHGSLPTTASQEKWLGSFHFCCGGNQPQHTQQQHQQKLWSCAGWSSFGTRTSFSFHSWFANHHQNQTQNSHSSPPLPNTSIDLTSIDWAQMALNHVVTEHRWLWIILWSLEQWQSVHFCSWSLHDWCRFIPLFCCLCQLLLSQTACGADCVDICCCLAGYCGCGIEMVQAMSLWHFQVQHS